MSRPSALPPVLLLTLAAAATTSGCSVLEPIDDPSPVVRGPLPVTTNGPIADTFLQFRPRRPTTTAPGAIDVGITSEYSSLFVNKVSGSSEVLLDAELWRTAVGVRTGLGPRTDVEVEVPVVYASDGFADQLIEGWHSLLGLPNGGRENRPSNDFEVHVDKGGQRIYELENNKVGIGDIPIVITQRIADESDLGVAISLRGGVELPTGSESDGFGNGGIDWGGGVLVESSVDRLTFTGAAYFVSNASSSAFEDADLAAPNAVQLQGGIEMRWNEAASILFGLRVNTPDTRDLDFGWIQDLEGGSRLVMGFTEGLTEASPDLTVFLAWQTGF
jgi:hypothetical protein